MTHRRTPVRLIDIVPDRLAREVTARVASAHKQISSALGARKSLRIAADLTATPCYQRVHALAAYAAWGEAVRDPEAEISWLAALLPLPLREGEPHTPLEAVILGARARQALAQGAPLTAAQRALIMGIDRDTVLARAARLPGAYRAVEERCKPWRFRVTRELIEWLGKREARSVA